MKSIFLVLAAIFLNIFSASAQKDGITPASVLAKEANLICPVTGEDADSAVSLAHDGTTYYFCCDGCLDKFRENPDKYMKSSNEKAYEPCEHDHAAAEGATAVINAGIDMSDRISNELCPVMGKKVVNSVTTVTYRGKVYGFCCKPCIKKFADNPEKYLKK